MTTALAIPRSVSYLAISVMLAACATHTGTPSPQTQGRLEVVNRSSSDMDIFVVSGGQRMRLGMAPGNKTTSFSLAPGQFAAGGVRFQAVPLLGLGRPIMSEPVMGGAQDTITLEIPPP